jgi:hypothetical protein
MENKLFQEPDLNENSDSSYFSELMTHRLFKNLKTNEEKYKYWLDTGFLDYIDDLNHKRKLGDFLEAAYEFLVYINSIKIQKNKYVINVSIMFFPLIGYIYKLIYLNEDNKVSSHEIDVSKVFDILVGEINKIDNSNKNADTHAEACRDAGILYVKQYVALEKNNYNFLW